MPIVGAQRFEIDSAFDVPADGYAAELPDASAFLAATPGEAVKLAAGLRDRVTQAVYTVGQLEGVVDEYVLTLGPRSLQASITGRDRLCQLLDRSYKKLFLRRPAVPEPTVAYQVGQFMASDIARQIVESVGLQLAWLCRNYPILGDFDAAGRPFDLLRKLVEPWAQVPAFPVDIYVHGGTVFCRERPIAPAPDYTMTVPNARVKSLTIRKKRGPLYGTVTLLGRLESKPGLIGGQGPSEPEEAEEPEVPPPIEPWETTEEQSHVTRDEGGTIVSQTIVTTVYRMPDRIPLAVTEQTFTRDKEDLLSKSAEKLTTNEWEPSFYDHAGAINRPRQLREVVLTRGIHPQAKAKGFQDTGRQVTSFAYDGEGYQSLSFTRKWELNLKAQKLEETERVEKLLADVEDLKTRQITSQYKPTKEGTWYLRQVDTQVSAGYRPAGPRPPKPEREPADAITSTGDVTKEAIKLEQTISEDPLAQAISYSNPNLGPEDLAYLLAKFRAASGLWEHEIRMDYVAMPWLRKGNVLQLTGLVDAAGTPIALQPALVTELRLSFDEGRANEMVSTLTARYWA